MGLKKRHPKWMLTCLDLAERLPEILEAGFADRVGTLEDSITELSKSDIVVLASPVETIIGHLKAIAPHLEPGTLVTDVGSTKSEIMRTAAASVPRGVHFVGGHPIAGSEKTGVGAGDSSLFDGRVWALCPFPDTTDEALLKAVDFVEDLRAVPLTIEPEEHDRVLAMTSHVPQILAITLVHAALQEDLEHRLLDVTAGRGFKDLTRIAASDFDMWKGVFETNRHSIAAMLERFESSLAEVKKHLAAGDIRELWEEVSARRRGME